MWGFAATSTVKVARCGECTRAVRHETGEHRNEEPLPLTDRFTASGFFGAQALNGGAHNRGLSHGYRCREPVTFIMAKQKLILLRPCGPSKQDGVPRGSTSRNFGRNAVMAANIEKLPSWSLQYRFRIFSSGGGWVHRP